MSHKQLGIIGAGAMGSAIAKGAIKANLYAASDIYLYDLSQEKLQELNNKHGFSTVNKISELIAVSNLEVIIIAVKPKDIKELLAELKDINKEVTLVSIAAGVELKTFEAAFPENPILRVMPNTPCQISKGVSVLAPGAKVTKEKENLVLEIFQTLGKALVMDESKLNAVTALSGSGPAYIFLMIEAMTEAGIGLGLDATAAAELALMTAYGASSLVYESGESPGLLREKVTSPGGTTQAALESFNNSGFKATVKEALTAAAQRAKELS